MTSPASPDAAEQHARTIRALSAPGAPLSQDSPHATVANPAWFFTPGRPTALRRRLHREILQPYRDRITEGVEDDRQAVVLAGPPGAGKSRILDELLGPKESPARQQQWLEVDPDEIKKKLLDAAAADGSYETFIKPPAVHDLEGQGEQFFPLDFAALVHEESSSLAKTIRNEAIKAGSNVVIDTVLSKPEAAAALGQQLEKAGYAVRIVDVEVPYEVSAARIADRWRGSYLEALAGEDRYGGRWVPESYVRSVYPDSADSRSRSQQSADALAQGSSSVVSHRRYWTPSVNAERVLEVDTVRHSPAVSLIDRQAAEVAQRAAASRPAPPRARPRSPGPERDGLGR